MRLGLFFIIVIFIAASCSVKTTENAVSSTNDATLVAEDTTVGFDENRFETYADLKNYLPDTTASEEDIQLVDSTTAILIHPTDEQITRMEKEYGDDFATIADDNSYYQSEAMLLLDSMSIKMINAEKRFLKLQGTQQSWTLDVRKEGAPEWNLILFNKNKEPEIITAIDLSREKLTAYFSN
jgi:hypothetical protein